MTGSTPLHIEQPQLPIPAGASGAYTDFHCHLLPAVDDGAADVEESLAIGRILARCGFGSVACTPHILHGGYDVSPPELRERVARLQEVLAEEGLPLVVHSGAEYYLDEFLLPRLSDPLPVPGALLLVEFPQRFDFVDACSTLRTMISRGLVPLIAHPERCDQLFASSGTPGFLSSLFGKKRAPVPAPVRLLKEMGCLLQGNIGSFAGKYGDKVKERVVGLLEEGYLDRLGTDAHKSHGLERLIAHGMQSVERRVGRKGLEKLLDGSW